MALTDRHGAVEELVAGAVVVVIDRVVGADAARDVVEAV
jgi:hypothetical protein